MDSLHTQLDPQVKNRAFASLFLYLLQPSFIPRQDVTGSQRHHVSTAGNIRERHHFFANRSRVHPTGESSTLVKGLIQT